MKDTAQNIVSKKKKENGIPNSCCSFSCGQSKGAGRRQALASPPGAGPVPVTTLLLLRRIVPAVYLEKAFQTC